MHSSQREQAISRKYSDWNNDKNQNTLIHISSAYFEMQAAVYFLDDLWRSLNVQRFFFAFINYQLHPP